MKKDHTPLTLQKELLAEIRPYLPLDRLVVLIADSEFGAVEVLTTVTAWGWRYSVRVKRSTHIQRPRRTLPMPWPRNPSPKAAHGCGRTSFGPKRTTLAR